MSSRTCHVALAHEKHDEPLIITPEEYIFGSSAKQNGDVYAKGSDIDVQEVNSSKEVEEDVQESDNEDNEVDAISKETAWSNKLTDFVIFQFSGQPGTKVKVPEEPRSDFFLNLIFKFDFYI